MQNQEKNFFVDENNLETELKGSVKSCSEDTVKSKTHRCGDSAETLQ